MLIEQIHTSESQRSLAPHDTVIVAGSAAATGSRIVHSEEVDRAFGMPLGKLRERAGIESLAYAADGESELTLGAKAGRGALKNGACSAQELDWIIATSETHLSYPSLSAKLHGELGAAQTCAALDVGGACLGLLNALAVAQSFILSGGARNILVVTADVHSRTLVPGRVPGEFGGLFGDGASAFVLRSRHAHARGPVYQLNKFLFGCATQYADAIRISNKGSDGLDLRFDGDALSRAAIYRMDRLIASLEELSGIARDAVGAFATHQPNPRLLALIAKLAGVGAGAFPSVARTCGNLGSSTCGAALDMALQVCANGSPRKPIFVASLGPGLLFAGTWLCAIG